MISQNIKWTGNIPSFHYLVLSPSPTNCNETFALRVMDLVREENLRNQKAFRLLQNFLSPLKSDGKKEHIILVWIVLSSSKQQW